MTFGANARHLPGLLGSLVRQEFDFLVHRAIDLKVILPLDRLDAFFDTFGGNHGLPGTCPNVVLVRADVPRRPDEETTVMAQAALGLLEELVDSGTVRIDPRFARRVELLAKSVWAQPLVVPVGESSPDPEGDGA